MNSISTLQQQHRLLFILMKSDQISFVVDIINLIDAKSNEAKMIRNKRNSFIERQVIRIRVNFIIFRQPTRLKNVNKDQNYDVSLLMHFNIQTF